MNTDDIENEVNPETYPLSKEEEAELEEIARNLSKDIADFFMGKTLGGECER